MNFEESVEYLSTLRAFGWRLDLSRMEALCARLGHPERAFNVVHVAGTNGKGSTTAMIAAILARSGYRTGSYYSPYVFNVRERVMVAERLERPEMIPEADFARHMTVIREHASEVGADESLGHPTEFEVKTMLAFLHFRERGVDWAVLETGLGGRLDATNVVQPEACVITNVGLDHTERLGDTIELIAGEKAGIIKPGAAVVTAAEEPALRVIRDAWESRGGAEWGRVYPVPGGWCGEHSWAGRSETQFFRPDPSRPAYQQANAALAWLTARVLKHRGHHVPDKAVGEGLARASLPGRFQVVRERPTVVLDGAHNPDGARALAGSLAQRYPGRPMTLVVGALDRHPAAGFLEAIAPVASRIIATQPDDRHALPAALMAAEAGKFGFDAAVEPEPMEAVRRAIRESEPDGVVVVTGSFYLVGAMDVDAITALPVPQGERA